MRLRGPALILFLGLAIAGCQKRNSAPESTSFQWEYDGYGRTADSAYAALKNNLVCGYPCSAIFVYKDCATGNDSSIFVWIPLPSLQPGVYPHPKYSSEYYNVQYTVGNYGRISAKPMFTGGSVTIDRFDSTSVSGHFELIDWYGKPVNGSFHNLKVRPQGR